MAEYQEKFLVLNLKHLEELTDEARKVFEDTCERVRDELTLDNKYYVCNQDEPYAGDVIKIILSGEDEKAAKKLGVERSKNSSDKNPVQQTNGATKKIADEIEKCSIEWSYKLSRSNIFDMQEWIRQLRHL